MARCVASARGRLVEGVRLLARLRTAPRQGKEGLAASRDRSLAFRPFATSRAASIAVVAVAVPFVEARG